MDCLFKKAIFSDINQTKWFFYMNSSIHKWLFSSTRISGPWKAGISGGRLSNPARPLRYQAAGYRIMLRFLAAVLDSIYRLISKQAGYRIMKLDASKSGASVIKHYSVIRSCDRNTEKSLRSKYICFFISQ